MKKDLPYNNNNRKTNMLQLAILALLILLGLLVMKNGFADRNESSADPVEKTGTVISEENNKMKDLILNEENLFNSVGVVWSDTSGGDRFGYNCFSSLCVTRRHSFDEETSYAEFYVKDYKKLSGTVFVGKDCHVYDDDSVTWQNPSIMIYGDGRLLKTFSGTYNIKTTMESFELDIADCEFVKIVFKDCYAVYTGLYDPSLFLGDLMVNE